MSRKRELEQGKPITIRFGSLRKFLEDEAEAQGTTLSKLLRKIVEKEKESKEVNRQ